MNREQFGILLGAGIVLNALFCFVVSLIDSYQLVSVLFRESEKELTFSLIMTSLSMSYLIATVLFVVSASLGWLLLKGRPIKLPVAITVGLANIFNGSIGFILAIVYLGYHVSGSAKDQQHDQASKGTH